jgi:hypothetical protein
VDGILHGVDLPPTMRQLFPAIISRIKVLSNLNLVERRLPQDGRASVKVGEEQLDLRISVLPTPAGESVRVELYVVAARSAEGCPDVHYEDVPVAFVDDVVVARESAVASFADLRGQIAALSYGERELLSLAERYGVEALIAFEGRLLDYTEALTRTSHLGERAADIQDIGQRVLRHLFGLAEDERALGDKVVFVAEDLTLSDLCLVSDACPGRHRRN